MFDFSFFGFIGTLFFNIVFPCLFGVPLVILLFDKKFSWLFLRVVSRFMWVAFIWWFLFNLQFFYFGISWVEICVWWILLVSCLFLKIYQKKSDLFGYFWLLTFSIRTIRQSIKNSFQSLSSTQRLFVVIGGVYLFLFTTVLVLSEWIFPTYADDSFGNWHPPVMNILHDGGITLWWEDDQVLGRGRAWYPIFFAVYKTAIASFLWFNDIFINQSNLLFFLFGLCIIFWFVRNQTKNIFSVILSWLIVCGLPLVFFHAIEWYLDLSSGIALVISSIFLSLFFKEREYNRLILCVLFVSILVSLKNDGIVYAWSIVLWAIIYGLLNNSLSIFAMSWRKYLWLFCVFSWIALPFLLLKMYYWWWFNQAAWEISWVTVQAVHREIFSVFPQLFFFFDNYNVILLFILFIIICKSTLYSQNNFWKHSEGLFAIIFLLIFSALLWTFLFTENYRWVLDQTTVNRVFTVVFLFFSILVPLCSSKIISHYEK
jgi:hypothetical protein